MGSVVQQHDIHDNIGHPVFMTNIGWFWNASKRTCFGMALQVAFHPFKSNFWVHTDPRSCDVTSNMCKAGEGLEPLFVFLAGESKQPKNESTRLNIAPANVYIVPPRPPTDFGNKQA